ncbi:MAG: chromosome segregation protein SMC [Arthrobacter sp.]|jgi:chromosome segregation protein|nr:chromosome segregation protein SMC [Arthrobacter sp.]
MYLKSLSIRGFKSFASATTFEFEPGVTAVVGPNGSGKSNVVDALAWVMGEQGAKTLRGGKMEDVIFAGTSGRAPLGRAQVALTIDNTDGALPIEYAEVTISRTLFRSGGSEYAINGSPARLLDIQELLSDSGLGREMHVIVGQGQLDRVLHATPEDRRGFIEEAAGILKHRRRKEKTLRKLDSTQANLDRLEDLTKEIARQLKPLGKQAATARRARTVQAALRDAKARLLADDLHAVRVEGAAADRAREEAQLALGEAQRLSDEGAGALARLEAEAASQAPAAAAARETWYELSRLDERFRALGALAQERRRLLGTPEPTNERSEDPEALLRRAEASGEEAAAARAAVEAAGEALTAAAERRADAEEAQRAEDQRITAVLRAVADRREGLARLAGSVGTARAKAEAAEQAMRRAQEQLGLAEGRGDEATGALDAARELAERLESALAGPRERVDHARRGRTRAEETLAEARRRLGPLTEARAALGAKVELLSENSAPPRDAEEYLAPHADRLLGVLADRLIVAPGHEAAVQAALAGAERAVVAEDRSVLEAVAASDAASPGARLRLVAPVGHQTAVVPPPGTRPLLEVVEADAEVTPVLRALLASTVVAPDDEIAQAASLAGGCVVVTPAGHRWEAAQLVLGGGAEPTALARRAALARAREAWEEATAAELEARAEVEAAEPAVRAGGADLEAAQLALRGAEREASAAAAELRRLETVATQAAAETQRHTAARERAATDHAAALSELTSLAERLEAAQAVPEELEPSTGERDRLAAAAVQARADEVEARLALRAQEEGARRHEERERSLRRAAEAERLARAKAAERAARRAAQAARAEEVERLVALVREALQRRIESAAGAVQEAEETGRRQQAAVQAARGQAQRLASQVQELKEAAHGAELGVAQREAKEAGLVERSLNELGLSPEALLEGFGPHVPVEVFDADAEDKWAALRQEVDEHGRPVAGVPYVRAEQEKRLKRAERDLAELGRVNPLALEEFAALEERHDYLVGQLADLRSSRADLLELVREVDDHVREVFASAFEDTSREFVKVFAKLFPGGEGRLRLTDPDNLLTTGIEVEARPAGKKVKRLSLLSGGERSLTAIALLVAIFTARPSPFYVMDEVEAALDERNLMRLLGVFSDLREHSQLIIITHQKHTMDIADALYGVSMRGDGVTRVISQRIERSDA